MSSPQTFSDFGIELPYSGASGDVYCRCPKCEPLRRHKNKRPLHVNTRDGVWWCNHCGESGSLVKGWNSDPQPSEKWQRAEARRLPPKPITPAPAAEAIKQQHVLEEQRGIPVDFMQQAGVVIANRWCMDCEDFVPMVALPYVKNGKVVHVKYRHTTEDGEKHFNTDDRTDRCLYGYDLVVAGDDVKPIVLCEGEYDALAIRYADRNTQLWRVASVPDGAGAINSRIEGQIKRGEEPDASRVKLPWLNDEAVAKALMDAPFVVFWLDTDKPGLRFLDELANRLGRERIRVVQPVKGTKDANDVLRAHGPDAILTALQDAEQMRVEGVIQLVHIETDLNRLYETGLDKGFSTGWLDLDSHIHLHLGQQWVVQGRTGVGKSHWLNALAINARQAAGWVSAIWSAEWRPVHMHAVSMIETLTGKPFDRNRYPREHMSLDLFQWGKDWLDENIVFLMPELPTVDQLLDRCRAAKVQRGAKLFILDNWMSMQHPTKGDKLDNIDKELTQIGNFAARENVLMVVVTHGTKPNGTQKMSDDLGVYGSAHSAAFGNKADVVLEVARYWPVDYVSAIKVSKVRSRYEGREGEIYLQFDKTTGRYLNIGPDSDLMGQIRESKRKGGRGNKSSGLLQEPTPAQKAAEPEPAPVENVVQLGLQR